jgi:hypothetical protein
MAMGICRHRATRLSVRQILKGLLGDRAAISPQAAGEVIRRSSRGLLTGQYRFVQRRNVRRSIPVEISSRQRLRCLERFMQHQATPDCQVVAGSLHIGLTDRHENSPSGSSPMVERYSLCPEKALDQLRNDRISPAMSYGVLGAHNIGLGRRTPDRLRVIKRTADAAIGCTNHHR